MKNDYGNPFSVCFNMMKIRYVDYSKSIDSLNFLKPTDKVNVFINFESVLSNISCIRDVDKKLILERDFPTILTSNILNLAAHYKRFFRQHNLETRVFIYYSDLQSTEYNLEKYIEDYRSYYMIKFMNNPRYAYLGEELVGTIIPDAQKIAEFIPNVYFIKATNFEGSLVPLIISSLDKSFKNLIVTGDVYDTQYQLFDDFATHYIRRSNRGTTLSYTIRKTLEDVFKETDDEVIPMEIISNKYFYYLIFSCIGDKPRSIEPVKGIGIRTVVKFILSGIDNGIITKNTNRIELLVNIFPEDVREQITNNFQAFNLESQMSLLTSQDIYDVEKQIVDRFDNNSLMTLNSGKFYNHQLMLQELTC